MCSSQQTEIGRFPKEWRLAKIDDNFSLQQGKSLSAKERTGEHLKPFLRTANVFWGQIDVQTVDEMDIPPKDRERLALRYGDVLVCEGGDIGRTAIWKDELKECYYQNHLHRLRPKNDSINPFFFVRWMEAGFRTLNLYAGSGNRTTIPNLSSSRLKEFKFPLPPVLEQKKIATVLSKLQRAIEVQDMLIQSMSNLKQSAMNYLFTYGLVTGEDIQKEERSRVAKYWKTSRLDEFIRLQRGFDITKRQQINGRVPVISSSGIHSHHATAMVKGPGVVIGRKGSLGTVHFVEEDFWPHDTTLWVTDFKGNKPLFIYYFLQTLRLQKLDTGTSNPTLNRNAVHALEVSLPDIPVQTEIANILQTIDKKLEAHESQKASLENLFKTALNRLMTGQVRVKDLDIDTSEVEVA
ncbi:MAG: hypothetical protein A2283_03790 [Lentisphaerae bacterium RIFOXYA12_FULL_48_11]|nr:MAG: hypothetical protein A2283_03790 [Lentisphaerae bacterium RIFOXYA12_FULL_48_11]